MQRFLIGCLLAITVREIGVSAKDDPDHQMVVIKEDLDQYDDDDVQPSAVDMRVVGGRAISYARLGGYMIALRYGGVFACGGTLIRDRIVLTAAHCFLDRLNKTAWTVDGGLSRISEKGERRKIKYYVISPDFRPKDLHSDVALILLDRPMEGRDIHSIPLCHTELKPGMRMTVSGWGYTTDGNMLVENSLRSVTVPFIDRETCRGQYKKSESVITDTMLCAGELGYKDACTFDSGGPLVYNKEVCGIVSFGIGCAHRRYPGVYTDVKSVKGYIKNSIKMLLSMH